MSASEGKKIVRVFPRKTAATPDDHLAFVGMPPKGIEADEVHISVAFTYDALYAEMLAQEWHKIAPVAMGGPALGDRGEDFVPGKYVKPGRVITSRGCPNGCWFCDVPRREGGIRELPITDGWNLLDSNLLACSEAHIRGVFEMLTRQARPVEFTGGLEAARLNDWHVDLLWQLRPSQIFFAYDTPNDFEPLVTAGRMLRYADFTRRHLRCYVLVGWPKDNMELAEKRLLQAWSAGFMPMAMLYCDKLGKTDPGWRKFQREWARPAITKSKLRQMGASKWRPE